MQVPAHRMGGGFTLGAGFPLYHTTRCAKPWRLHGRLLEIDPARRSLTVMAGNSYLKGKAPGAKRDKGNPSIALECSHVPPASRT